MVAFLQAVGSKLFLTSRKQADKALEKQKPVMRGSTVKLIHKFIINSILFTNVKSLRGLFIKALSYIEFLYSKESYINYVMKFVSIWTPLPTH